MKFGKTGLGFGKKPKKQVPEPEQPQTDYVKRAKAEQDRFKLATDSEFWLCFCFRDKKHLSLFEDKFGKTSQFIDGNTFRGMTKSARPQKQKRGFARPQKTGIKTKDPLADVAQTDSLEKDCFAEADALLQAMLSVKVIYPLRQATDSDIWFCVYFRDREDVESYLSEMGITRFGNKYVDASAWMKNLGIL